MNNSTVIMSEFPAELQNQPWWIHWKREGKPLECGRFKKCLLSPKTGEPLPGPKFPDQRGKLIANKIDYALEHEALDAVSAITKLAYTGADGIGIIFPKNSGYFYLDMDYVFRNTQLNHEDRDIVEDFNTYTEYSMRGGLHVIGKCTEQLHNKFVVSESNNIGACGTSIATHAFLIPTGHVYRNYTSIEDRTDQAIKLFDNIEQWIEDYAEATNYEYSISESPWSLER